MNDMIYYMDVCTEDVKLTRQKHTSPVLYCFVIATQLVA